MGDSEEHGQNADSDSGDSGEEVRKDLQENVGEFEKPETGRPQDPGSLNPEGSDEGGGGGSDSSGSESEGSE